MVLSTTILLAFGALTLSVLLILTIAYLWIYLGHYTNITVDVKPTHAPHNDKVIAYKGKTRFIGHCLKHLSKNSMVILMKYQLSITKFWLITQTMFHSGYMTITKLINSRVNTKSEFLSKGKKSSKRVSNWER